MIARIVIAVMIAIAVTAGVALYWLQERAFYVVFPDGDPPVELTSRITGLPEDVGATDIRAIDADSSPIRFRSCFAVPLSMGTLTDTYVTYPEAEPLNAPDWFDCFDAAAIGAALESGEAVAFLGTGNIHYGIDRVVAVFPDGRGYAWQQINACGAVIFDGDPPPEGCPPPPADAP